MATGRINWVAVGFVAVPWELRTGLLATALLYVVKDVAYRREECVSRPWAPVAVATPQLADKRIRFHVNDGGTAVAFNAYPAPDPPVLAAVKGVGLFDKPFARRTASAIAPCIAADVGWYLTDQTRPDTKLKGDGSVRSGQVESSRVGLRRQRYGGSALARGSVFFLCHFYRCHLISPPVC